MTDARCETCRYWQHVDINGDGDTGRCRRHAPQATALHWRQWYQTEELDYVAEWLRTYDHDWCGEWAPREQATHWLEREP